MYRYGYGYDGYVYIMTNQKNGTLYVGVTSDVYRRVYVHKIGVYDGSTQRYKLFRLVYMEYCASICDAIAREKQLKAGKKRSR